MAASDVATGTIHAQQSKEENTAKTIILFS